jgi:23S rRNA pseudouridine955/2504/2580 synthase
VRIPPLAVDRKSGAPVTARTMRGVEDADVLSRILLYEDDKVLVFDKPSGLAVQGGSGVVRSVDSMLEAWRNKKGEKPRLVHRLDRDTSGVLVVARSRLAAMKLAESFKKRETKKTYWALVKGVPKQREGKISTWLIKEPTPDGDRMRVADHGEKGADHAVSFYRVVEQAGQNLSWLEMEPYTGRTHQLRVHAAHIGCPIIGDPKYFEADQNWEFPGRLQNRLHLHARRIVIPHPDKGIDRRLRAAAAAYAPELEPARLRRGGGGGRRVNQPLSVFEKRDHIDTLAVGMMLMLTFAWGFNQVAIKVSTEGYSPIFLTFARSAMARCWSSPGAISGASAVRDGTGP